MKTTLRKQIVSAVMAVLLTAGLGTAALASSEPIRPAQETTQADTQRPELPPDAEGAPSGEPQGQVPEAPDGELPDKPEENGRPENGAEPGGGPSGEQAPQAPDGQNVPDAPGGEPAQPASGEMDRPSGEPGASQEPGNSQPSGEPDARQEAAPHGGQGRENSAQESFDLMGFFRDLWGRLQSLFGGRSDAQPVSVSPDFGDEPAQTDRQTAPDARTDAPAEAGQPSGEEGASREMGASNEMSSSGEMGGSGEPAAYTAAVTLTEDSDGAAYASSSGGENAVLVSGRTVTMTGATVNKTGSSAGDSADFYGVNAGILATDGATLTIEGAEVVTDGAHANGVFSYGAGTTVSISDSAITTSADNSGGIMTTGGGVMNAVNLTVSTAGNSSAAIRSDRGGGTVNVTEGSYATSGVGSPAVYSTADITVTDATLASATSEAVVIEGGNSVTLTNSDVSGNNSRLNGQSTVNTNVLIYQSMSGDAAEGNSTFTMTGGSMTAGTGAMFHVTNVTTEINLSGVDFTYASDSDVFLDASSDSWGTAGKNGGNVVLNLDSQDIVGVITADSASSVALTMKNGSTWTLTGDSYVTSLDGDTSGIDLNGYTLYVNGGAWNG